MVGKILIPEIRNLIEARNFAGLREIFRDWPRADVAEVILDLPADDRVIIFRILPAALLEEMPSATTRQLIQLLTPEERRIAQALLGYPEGSVGRLMTPDFVAVRENWTVREVLDYVREHGQDSETLNFLYVVDERGKLIDDLRIRNFLLRPLDTRVDEITDRNFVHLRVNETQEEALKIFRKYDRAALPVVDSSGVLLGIVTQDDMLDVAEEEATEDIQKIGGMEALDEPYMRISLWRMVRKRAGWLIILFLGEMLTATAMANYQNELAKALVLALFLPLIISSGGNSGSQASTLMIRAMALGEVTLRDWWRVMGREVQAGLSLGVILGTIGIIRVTAWAIVGEQYFHQQPYGAHWPLVALTVGVALFGVVLWGTLSGSMLPFLLRRVGADPATSSAPFVATLVDVTGLVIYFSIALVIMRGAML